MKTRIIALVLLLSLALCLTACDDKTTPGDTTAAAQNTQAPETQAHMTQAPETQAPETSTQSAVIATTEVSVTNPPDAELPSNEHPTEAPEVDASLRGIQSDDAYVNDVLKLRIAKPEGWVFYTEEQLAAVNNITAQLLDDTRVAELMAQNGQMIIMALAGPNGNNVNLVIQPKNALLDLYDDEKIFQLSKATVEAQLKSAGMELQSYEVATMTVGGEERTVLNMEVTMSGITMREYQIWFRGSADYMGVVTVAIMDDADVQPILDGITSLD